MPDDQDYTELGRLLSDPRGWTPSEAATMRCLLREQTALLATVQPFDTRRRERLQALADQIAAALQIAEASAQEHRD